jgi:transcriptional regulator with XRE-family HTH domain
MSDFQPGDNQMTVEEMEKTRPLSAGELAELIRTFREMRQWSQDTLSALSKLSIRTIQRVENGEPSNGDTRRALALAFEFEDIDVFNKPVSFPDPQQLQAEMEKFKREHVTLEARIVSSGQELARLIENADCDSCSSAVELQGVAAEAFAGLVDYLHDYRECADCMSETEKLGGFGEVQGYLDTLHKAGFTLSYARRDTKLVSQDWVDKRPLAWSIVYLVVFPKGGKPKRIFAPRHVRL